MVYNGVCMVVTSNTGPLGTIHILRHHIFGIFGPPSPLCQHVFSTKNKQKVAFSDPSSPPTSADVIYEWSPAFHGLWMYEQWGLRKNNYLNINFILIACCLGSLKVR